MNSFRKGAPVSNRLSRDNSIEGRAALPRSRDFSPRERIAQRRVVATYSVTAEIGTGLCLDPIKSGLRGSTALPSTE